MNVVMVGIRYLPYSFIMKKTTVLKRDGEYEWESWFAWHPVWLYSMDRMPDGTVLNLETRVWLEWVERRDTDKYDVSWEYRLPLKERVIKL